MTTPPLAERVAAGVEWLDAAYPHWRGDALAHLSLDRQRLVDAIALVRRRYEPALDDATAHDWHLARGFTVDYSGLGYPDSAADTPRRAREYRAWAELEAAWWRIVAP